MPTVLTSGPYRFFFYSADNHEPPHIHVERDASVAKFWLDPVHLASSNGFRSPELRKLERLVEMHRDQMLQQWDEYFDN